MAPSLWAKPSPLHDPKSPHPPPKRLRPQLGKRQGGPLIRVPCIYRAPDVTSRMCNY